MKPENYNQPSIPVPTNTDIDPATKAVTNAQFDRIDALEKKRDEKRVRIQDFEGVKYVDPEKLKSHIEEEAQLSAKFHADLLGMTIEGRGAFEKGLIAENVFSTAIQEYGWLAPKVEVISTSKYDDYKSHIDFVSQVTLGDGKFEHLGFALDFSSNVIEVGKKLMQTARSLDKGYSPSVKYFDSEKTGKLIGLKMPRIVVGAGREALSRLVDYNKEIDNHSGVSEQVKKELRNDPFRYVMLGEIKGQLAFCIFRLKAVIADAKQNNHQDILRNAQLALKMHENALSNFTNLLNSQGVNESDIERHRRGDNYAKMLVDEMVRIIKLPLGV